MKKRKIIIDTDPGIDDAFALLTAFNYQGFDLLGVTVVAGNTGLNSALNNALGLVKLAEIDCQVYPGAHSSLKNLQKGAEANPYSSNTHGEGGLGGVVLEVDRCHLSTTSAADFIIETVKDNPGQIELITLGPLTNLALAIQKDPVTMRKVKKIWSMGGGVQRGNRTVVAEFNYWADPEAVDLVYSLGEEVEINMIGLDVTAQTSFTINELFFLKKEGGKIGRLLSQMAEQYTEVYWDRFRITGCIIHDLVAVMIAIDPTICSESDRYQNVNLRIETAGLGRGQTLVDLYGHRDLKDYPKNATVYMGIDQKKYKQRFIEVLFNDLSDLYQKYLL